MEKKSGELIIVVSLLFSASLAQAGKTSEKEIVVRKTGIALEQEAIKKVEPEFPPIAKAVRASGEVKVEVTIDKTGKVVSARVVSGHPLLRGSAQAAARQWKFKPTMVSGKPAKVGGLLTFNFVLDDGKKTEAEVGRENLDPSQARLDRGTDLLKSYRYDEAIAEFREAIHIKPDNLFAHYKLGLAYIEAGRYTEGEATCERALTITREKQRDEFDLSNLLVCLGEAKFRLGKNDEAINAFKRVAEMNPKVFDVQIRLAHSLARKGANDEAISVLKECLTLEPKNANVPYILAGVYLIQGHLDEVITYLKNAVSLAPDHAEAHFGLGMAYSAIGDKRAAMQEYRILKKLDKKQAEQLLSNINQ
ncbi:MAG: TonB family protein [Blastocatellia bacterium]